MAKRKTTGPDAIAIAVKAELERRGMTMMELATKMGDVYQSDLSFWFSGQRSMRSDKASRILAELGLVIRRAR